MCYRDLTQDTVKVTFQWAVIIPETPHTHQDARSPCHSVHFINNPQHKGSHPGATFAPLGLGPCLQIELSHQRAACDW